MPLRKKFIKKRTFITNLDELKNAPKNFPPNLDELKGVSKKTPRQEYKETEAAKDKVPEFKSFPATSIVPNTSGVGALGIGYLKPRPNVSQEYEVQISPQGRPIITVPKLYLYFFVKYDNKDISVSIGKHLKSFVVVLTLSPTTVKNVAEMMGVPVGSVTALTRQQYLTDSFSHPTYTNDSNEPLQIRYAEIAILRQTTPGRLDNIPLGFPDFDSTPDGIVNVQGPIPAAPYTNFTSSTGATASVTIIPGGTVSFKDTSPNTPWQFAPTGWYWEFGPSASPTGSTQQNPLVTYGTTGSYTVTLTASNATGSTTKTKTNFVIVTN